MVQTQKLRHGADLEPVKAQKKLKPGVGSKIKQAMDQIAREVQWHKVACSCCGKPFELPFKPERTDRPLYGPCCDEERDKGSF
ncbi:MAG: hypothetical protein NTY83_04195 [Candidatus Micrarchaeota archaeon]|nr:hypothetical protein [Candidatus Micrarchaeota archaeon]